MPLDLRGSQQHRAALPPQSAPAVPTARPLLVQKWSPACYGLLNYSMNTMYVRTSSFFSYFFRQSDGTPWNLASVANYTA